MNITAITNLSKSVAAVVGSIIAIALLLAVLLQGSGSSLTSLFVSAAPAQPVPVDVQAFAAEFNEHQLMANLDYNVWDYSYQPALAGMETCWAEDGSSLTYVMKQGERFSVAVIDASADGENMVAGSGTNSARWDACVEGGSSSVM